MEAIILECGIPLINCLQGHVGIIGVIIGGIFIVMGAARSMLKPVQPLILSLVEKTDIKWDNKVAKYVYWAIDYFFSLKLENPKDKEE